MGVLRRLCAASSARAGGTADARAAQRKAAPTEPVLTRSPSVRPTLEGTPQVPEVTVEPQSRVVGLVQEDPRLGANQALIPEGGGAPHRTVSSLLARRAQAAADGKKPPQPETEERDPGRAACVVRTAWRVAP